MGEAWTSPETRDDVALTQRSTGGLDATHANWPSLLPPGQRQCLAAARLCFHAPALALVDEGTSMMSTEAEAAVYAALRQRGIAVLSVGHRESLRPLHDQVLVLEPDDG